MFLNQKEYIQNDHTGRTPFGPLETSVWPPLSTTGNNSHVRPKTMHRPFQKYYNKDYEIYNFSKKLIKIIIECMTILKRYKKIVENKFPTFVNLF